MIRDTFQMERVFMLSEFGSNLNGSRYKLMYSNQDNAESKTVLSGSKPFHFFVNRHYILHPPKRFVCLFALQSMRIVLSNV
jgi:hypothetical protein